MNSSSNLIKSASQTNLIGISNGSSSFSINKKISKEDYDKNSAKISNSFLGSSSNLMSGGSQTNLIKSYNIVSSNKNINDNSSYYVSAGQNSLTKSNQKFVENVEYETITTQVSENMASQIIAEAKATGTVKKSIGNRF